MYEGDPGQADEPVAALHDALGELVGAGRKVIEAVEHVLADPKLRQQVADALGQMAKSAQGVFGAFFEQQPQRPAPPVEHIDVDGD